MQYSSTGIGYISPFTRIIEFLFGMIAAAIFIRIDRPGRHDRLVWTLAEVAAFAAVPTMWIFTRNLPDRIAGHGLGTAAWSVFMAHCGSFVAFGVLVLIMALGRGLISRALSVRPLVLLGEASFALYMVHQLIISYFYLNRPKFDGIPDMVLFVGYWTIAIASAFALWRFVEGPARNAIRRRFSAMMQRAANPALARDN